MVCILSDISITYTISTVAIMTVDAMIQLKQC